MNKKIVGVVQVGLIVAAFVAIPSVSRADTITRYLQVGSRGSDVSSVQSFFAQDPTIYPQGLVTGYFGFLTKAAVSNFQSRNNISPVGRIGPVTLPVLNAQMALGMNGGISNIVKAPAINNVSVGVSKNSATVTWSTDELAKGVVYYSTVPLSFTEHVNSVDISGSSVMTDTNFRTSQNISVPGLSSNTTYYYSVYSTNQQGNSSLTWPATFRTSN